jgi:hypothetical protein
MRVDKDNPTTLKSLQLLPPDIIEAAVKAIDDANDELRRLNLEVCNLSAAPVVGLCHNIDVQ